MGERDPLDLFLEVYIGERSTGRIIRVRLHSGELWVRVEDLYAIGLVSLFGAQPDGEGWLRLDAVPGIAYRYDAPTQRLILNVAPALWGLQQVGYDVEPPPDIRRDPGGLVTYRLYADRIDGWNTLGSYSLLRWFGPFGAIETSLLGRADGSDRFMRRLETRWVYSNPERLWTWTAGDFITGALGWTQATRMAGLQLRSNFGLRPDLVTIPLARFSGEAAVPSSVELYINDVRNVDGQLREGPYVVEAVPRIAGAGTATFVVTDALGRVTETHLPIYVDRRLLAAGLTDFSLQAGVLRTGYASADDRYFGPLVGSGSARYGASDALTLEAHTELGGRVAVMGVGALWAPWRRYGLVSGSIARSGGSSKAYQYSLGYQWVAGGWGIDLQSRRRTSGFRDLADLTRNIGVPTRFKRIRDLDQATVWIPVRRGSLGLTVFRWREREQKAHHTGTITLTQTVRRVSVSANVFGDELNGRRGGLSLSIPLGGARYASAGVHRQSSDLTTSSFAVQRSAPYGGGWGWRAQGGTRGEPYTQAEALVRGRRVEARFGGGHAYGTPRFAAEIGGAIVAMDRRLFLSRPIHDAFAIVSTNGRADVPILSENRLIGRTGEDGYLLVPDLIGWQRNRIGIETERLDFDETVGQTERIVTPADRSGLVLRFDIKRTRPALVSLLGPEGKPVQTGTVGRIAESDETVVVGFGGEIYIEDLSTPRVVEVNVDGVQCRYSIPVPAELTEGLVRVGPLMCEEGPR